MYDALLGGKDNFEVGRVVSRSVVEADPLAPGAAKAIRRWLVRCVRWLTDRAEMHQFLDCGSGLPPTVENTHEAAQRVNSGRVVVDVDDARHLMDEDGPGEIMASCIDALPSGSYVALCHFDDPETRIPNRAPSRRTWSNGCPAAPWDRAGSAAARRSPRTSTAWNSSSREW